MFDSLQTSLFWTENLRYKFAFRKLPDNLICCCMQSFEMKIGSKRDLNMFQYKVRIVPVTNASLEHYLRFTISIQKYFIL